jgi:putative transposase
MQVSAMKVRPKRRRLPMDVGERPVSEFSGNVLDRQFNVSAPNRSWAADFTYICTPEGWLYVAVVLDLFWRRIVGWAMRSAMTADLVTDALTMALWRRGKPRELLHHSDRGSQRAMQPADG